MKNYIVWIIYHENIIQEFFNNFVREQIFSLIISTEYNNINLILCFNKVFAHKNDKF